MKLIVTLIIIAAVIFAALYAGNQAVRSYRASAGQRVARIQRAEER